MKKFAVCIALTSASVFAVGCGGGGYTYEPPPENADVSPEVRQDAGVVTDPELMGAGANSP